MYNVLLSCDIHYIIKGCYESSSSLCGCTCFILVSAYKHGGSQTVKLLQLQEFGVGELMFEGKGKVKSCMY
jgi:hypothetical protein